ncbi:hypothetical protein ACTFIW_000066 [Dictyostelium discoideum]
MIESIEYLYNFISKNYFKFKFYFSPKFKFCKKLKKILEWKKVNIEEYEIRGISNLIFDNENGPYDNKIALVVWNINEMIRRIKINHPILGTVELIKQTITNLIINNGGNYYDRSENSIFFFQNYHQMVICFTNIYLTRPWLRKEVNYNDLANLYFISKGIDKNNLNEPIVDFHPIPFSCLLINDNNNVNNNNNNNNNNNTNNSDNNNNNNTIDSDDNNFTNNDNNKEIENDQKE